MKGLKEVANNAGLTESDIAEITGASAQEVAAWFEGTEKPSWSCSLKIMLRLSVTASAYRLPPEDDVVLETLEKKVTQAEGTADMLFQQATEGTPTYGVTWGLSDALAEVRALVKKLRR